MAQIKIEQIPIRTGEEGQLTEFAKAAQTFIGSQFSDFKSQRSEGGNGDGSGNSIDDKMITSEMLWHAGASRTMMRSEIQNKGTRSEETKQPRADVGSKTFFHNGISVAGKVLSKLILRDGASMPWRYEAPRNKGSHSWENEQAFNHDNTKAESAVRYSMAKDHYNEKVLALAVGLGKFGNMPVVYSWQEKKRKIWTRTESGKAKEKEITEEFTSLDPLDIATLYADLYGGQLSEQACVMYYINQPFHEIHMNRALFDQQSYKELWKQKQGLATKSSSSNPVIEYREKVRGKTTEFSRSNDAQWKVWYVYANCPLTNENEWADENVDTDDVEYKLVRFTLCGPEPTASAVMLAAELNTTPDKKIPMQMVWLVPDNDKSKLYHVMPIELVRSDYATETAFTNMAIDNGREISEPRRIVNTELMGTLNLDADILFADDVQRAMVELRPPDIINSCMRMRDAMKMEAKQAFVISDNAEGQSFGARTSANEAFIIDKYAAMTDAILHGYSAEMFLRVYAAKARYYFSVYASQALELMVTGGEMMTIEAADLWGDFDVTVNVIDNEEQDAVTIRTMDSLLGMIAQSPLFQNSETHSIDIGAMLMDAARARGMHRAPHWILPSGDEDAIAKANEENDLMLSGEQAEVLPGQRHGAHKRVHNMTANRVRAILAGADKGMVGDREDIARAQRILNILNQHSQIHTEYERQQQAAMQQQMQQAQQGGGGYENMGAQGGTLEGQPPLATMGQIEGGALGGETGGAVI